MPTAVDQMPFSESKRAYDSEDDYDYGEDDCPEAPAPAPESSDEDVLMTVLRIEAEEDEAASRRALQALSDADVAQRIAADEQAAARARAAEDVRGARVAAAEAKREDENHREWAAKSACDEDASLKVAAKEAKEADQDVKTVVRTLVAERKATVKTWSKAQFGARVREGALVFTITLPKVDSVSFDSSAPGHSQLGVKISSGVPDASALERLRKLNASAATEKKPSKLSLLTGGSSGGVPKQLSQPVTVDVKLGFPAKPFIWDVLTAKHSYCSATGVLKLSVQRCREAPRSSAERIHEISVSYTHGK